MGSSAGAWLALPQANTAPPLLPCPQALFLLQGRQPGLDVRVAYMEGLGFRQQAAWFASADVLLIPHGAATASFVFLPRQAAVVQAGGRPHPARTSSRSRSHLPWRSAVGGARARQMGAGSLGPSLWSFPPEMPLPTSERARTHACRPFPPRQVSSYIVHKNHDEALARRPPKEFYTISYSSE